MWFWGYMHWFVPLNKNRIRPRGQAVKTTPSHGVNPGSIPGEVISVQTEMSGFFEFKSISNCIVKLHYKIPWLFRQNLLEWSLGYDCFSNQSYMQSQFIRKAMIVFLRYCFRSERRGRRLWASFRSDRYPNFPRELHCWRSEWHFLTDMP